MEKRKLLRLLLMLNFIPHSPFPVPRSSNIRFFLSYFDGDLLPCTAIECGKTQALLLSTFGPETEGTK